ncbi:MarR family winged helix-turn-helix transcriptional regulator [Georgenia sp. Z1491]|uniref:MarR family winged helix-turn-helix transcriptional regulator n=1 Tax=Georgenia sp. Z1491 TaxID=3416707 RepID=UPI003CEA39E1
MSRQSASPAHPHDERARADVAGDGRAKAEHRHRPDHAHGTDRPHGPDHAHEPDTYELIVRAARQVRRRWMEALESDGPSPHEFRALRAAVAADGGARLADIAERLRIAPRSATEVVDSLEAKGLVRRTPSPTDRRAILVEPTGSGRALAEEVAAARAAHGAALLAPLDEDEAAQLHALLARVVDAAGC